VAYSFAATPKEEIISDTFPLSEEGRLQLVDWLKQMYEKDKERWESAPTILEAPIDLNAVYSDKDKK